MSCENRPGASSHSATPTELERGAARYLFAIARCGSTDEGRVTTGALQARLDVAGPSVTEMLSKLDDRGLVDYEAYRGAMLTDRGERQATRVVWRYCAVSTFFESVLDTALDEQTAFDVGFVLPTDGVHRLQDLAGSPCLDTCPGSTAELGGRVV